MYRTALKMLGWLGCLAAIGQVPVALAAVTDEQAQQPRSAITDQQTIQQQPSQTSNEPSNRAQYYQAQPSGEPRSQNNAPSDTQKPQFTDDVRLRVETYTGNDYSK